MAIAAEESAIQSAEAMMEGQSATMTGQRDARLGVNHACTRHTRTLSCARIHAEDINFQQLGQHSVFQEPRRVRLRCWPSWTRSTQRCWYVCHTTDGSVKLGSHSIVVDLPIYYPCTHAKTLDDNTIPLPRCW
jgi:hypothetical protein